MSYGCAPKDYVRQQVEPLENRISKLEAAQKNCASQADVDQAKRDAAEALKTVKDCCNKGEAAAERAEAAAKKAEAAAKKAEKAFELQQKK